MSDSSGNSEQLRRRLLAASAYLVNVVGAAAVLYATPHYWKQPYHTSALTGAQWVKELLQGHPDRIYNELGMRLHVFLALVYELQSLCSLESVRVLRRPTLMMI